MSNAKEESQKEALEDLKPQNAPSVEGTPEDDSEPKGAVWSLHLEDPVFRRRTNSVVRPGDRWARRVYSFTRENVQITLMDTSKGAPIGSATIMGMGLTHLSFVPLRWISLHHTFERPGELTKNDFRSYMKEEYTLPEPPMVTTLIFTIDHVKDQYLGKVVS